MLTAEEQLQAIYAELPTVECKRLCQAYCGPLVMPRVECVQIEKTGAIFTLAPISSVELDEHWDWMPKDKLVATIPREGSLDCTMLYQNGKCRVYAKRPLICRIWGMHDSPLMRCPHGCIPDRWLSLKEISGLMKRILEIQP